VEIFYCSALLAVAAFWLAACPFSVWIGKWLLGRDIKGYGDSNPGAYNVFRAGGWKVGVLAMVVDIVKGVPFVALAHYYFELPMVAVMSIGLCAILGHAYSPLLHFQGGKALAVTGGVMFALPQHEIVISVLVFMFIGFLLIDVDGWRVMFSMGASVIYLVITEGLSLAPLFVLCVTAILVMTHFDELKTMPRFRGKLITWLQARKMAKLRGH
jgi:glycerol-3-phosphate acyltransferase PlsY